MKIRQKGEWIRDTYEVLNVFPFVQGVLYYTQVSGEKDGEEEAPRRTRFIHALDVRYLNRNAKLNTVLKRDRSAFFPLRGLFVEEGVLYQVFNRLDGTLLAHHLYRSVPLSLEETVHIVKQITKHLMQLYQSGQFTVVHPQNMLLTGDEVRFLYGGPSNVLPKGIRSKSSTAGSGRVNVQALDAYSLGALAYIMLTGTSPNAEGQIKPIRTFRRDVPPQLEQFILHALSPDPGQRPTVSHLWEWIKEKEMRQEGGELLKKKAEALPGRTAGLIASDIFSQQVAAKDQPRVTSQSASPGDWEGWSAGDLDGAAPSASKRASKPAAKELTLTQQANDATEKLQPVWHRTEPLPEETPARSGSPQVTEDSSRELPARGERKGNRRKKKVWIASTAAGVLLLLGAGGAVVYSVTQDSSADQAAASQTEKAAKAYAKSVQFYQEGKLDEAISFGKQAVKAAPKEKEYLLHLGDLYRAKRDYTTGIKTLEAGVQRIPDAEVYDQLAMMALSANEMDKANQAIDQAIAKDPDNGEYIFHKGKIFGVQKEYERATDYIIQAIEKEPDNALYYHDLAVFLLDQGKYADAKANAIKATKLDPQRSEYWLTTGVVYLEDRKHVGKDKSLSAKERSAQRQALANKALQYLVKAVQLDPQSGIARYHLSVAQYYLGQYKNAAQSAAEAVEISPKTALFQYQLGITLFKLGEKDQAAERFQMAANLEPGNSTYQKAAQSAQ
jgi:tetratricopeptide (TPR) repeat protein